jgi:energy-coupling factor transport system permease protein
MHPLIRILAVVFLAILVQAANASLLGLAAALILLANLYAGGASMFRLLRRSRWLILMLLVIYAFATPGEYVSGWPLTPFPVPTYEGLLAGVSQAVRMTVMLGGIALLLTITPRDELIAGIYLLTTPIRYFGGVPERFAARLWLSLHYVEQRSGNLQWQGWQSFSRIADPESEPEQDLILEIPLPRIHDWVVLALMCAVCLYWSLS